MPEQEAQGLLLATDADGASAAKKVSLPVLCALICGCTSACIAGALSLCTIIPSTPNFTEELINSKFAGDPNFGYWRMPHFQNRTVLSHLNSQLANQTAAPWKSDGAHANATLGYALAKEAVHSMYTATKVKGVWEKIPKDFQGVFWMKGNGVAEELAVLQYAEFLEDEKILLVPVAPFMWSWPAGRPSKAPYSGAMYDPSWSVFNAEVFIGSGDVSNTPISLSFKFNDDDLSQGDLLVHKGDLTADYLGGGAIESLANNYPWLMSKLKELIRVGRFNLERLPSESSTEEPGSSWKRGCYWGWGICTFFEFGSYNLVKILKHNGEPNEPYYSEFLDYMGDVPLLLWSGFAS